MADETRQSLSSHSEAPSPGDGRDSPPYAAVSPISESFVPLAERAVRRDGTVRLKLIGPGWGSSGYYSRQVLERDVPKVFPPRTQQFWNHDTATEEAERPEGDLSRLASVIISTPVWEDGPSGPGMYADARAFAGYAEAIDQMGEFIGVSIRAAGVVAPGEAEGRKGNIVQSIVPDPVVGARVDYVTRPGAGGAIVSIFESAPNAPKLPDPKTEPPTRTAAELIQEAGRVLSSKNEKELRAGQEALQAALKALTAVLEQLADGEEASTEAKEAMRRVKEARNIGQFLESRLHLTMTQIADDLYGESRLTRNERKALSAALGDALDAYTATIQAEAPQLYARDWWANAPDEDEVSESNGRQSAANNPTQENNPMSDKQTPTPAADQPENDLLAEARRQTLVLEAENARLREQILLRDATEFVRGKLAESDLPEITRKRLVKELVSDPPISDGKVNEAELAKRVTTAINEAQVEINAITGGSGKITGMGSTTPTATYANGNGDVPTLEESEKRIEAALGRLHGGRNNGN